jgi:hypothetical protein
MNRGVRLSATAVGAGMLATLGLTGCGQDDTAADTHQGARVGTSATAPTLVNGLFVTDKPRVLWATIDESGTDPSKPCWVGYGISAKLGENGTLVLSSRISKPAASEGGASCTQQGVAVYQQVNLPVDFDHQRVIDAATGRPVPVEPKLPDLQKYGKPPYTVVPYSP